MPAPALTFHAVSDVGRGREQNEDSRGEVSAAGGELLVVCDGMGGHESGEVASRIAVDAIMQIFQNSPSSDPAERLKNGFLVANQRILAHAEKAGLDGMGTTAVAAFVKGGEAWIAHVGDSRCYHLRDEAVLWRTADHTRVQKMIDRGILTPEQAKTHEDANVVTRALGFTRGEEQPEPDITAARELREGDLLLLCSDGLFDLVKDEEIAELASDDEPHEAAQRLVDLANRRGGHDNITVTIVRFGAAAKRSGGARKTDLDEPGPGPSAMKTTDVAKSAAAAREIVAREKAKEAAKADPQSKKALGLVIAGIALVGIAAAVFLLTRGGDDEPARNPARDAGAAMQGGSADAAVDQDAGSAAATVDGGSLTAPTWDTPDRPRNGGGGGGKKPGAGSAAGSGSGAGSSAGSGSGSGGGSGAGPAAGSGAGPGSGTGTGSGGSGSGKTGFAGQLTGGSGAGSSAPKPQAPSPQSPGPQTTPPTPTTSPNPTTPTTPTTPPRTPALQPKPVTPRKQPATTPNVSPPGMTPPSGSTSK